MKKNITFYAAMLCVLLFVIWGLRSQQLERYSERKDVMTAPTRIDVCIDGKIPMEEIKAAYAEAWARLDEIAWRMNVFDERSDVAYINNSHGQPVKIPDDTYFVLKQALEYNKLSQGAFDITVWPLIKFWKESAKAGVYPSEEQIQSVVDKIGSRRLELLPDNFVKTNHPELQIDLGGIAAGYAVDEVVAIFRRHAIQDFFIDLGGDVYAGGENCEGKKWRVGVLDPRDRSKVLEIIYLSDVAVTTSGNYEKFYTLNGKKLSHIVNPITGRPQEDMVSATVIAPTAIAADVLATAVMVMGKDKGLQMIEDLPSDHAAVVLTPEGDSLEKINRYATAEYPSFLLSD